MLRSSVGDVCMLRSSVGDVCIVSVLYIMYYVFNMCCRVSSVYDQPHRCALLCGKRWRTIIAITSKQ